MDLQKEQKYIDNFMSKLSDQEFLSMLEDCGNNVILPTKDIYRQMVEAGFYKED